MVGNWGIVTDTTAAGGARLASRDENLPAIGKTAAKSPSDYFELTFDAEAGRAYRLWIRGRAENDDLDNDSVYLQFSGSVDAAGLPVYRIGHQSGGHHPAAALLERRQRRMPSVGMGLARQQQPERVRRPDLLCPVWPADHQDPAARRRDVDRPDRPVALDLPQRRPRSDAERHDDPAGNRTINRAENDSLGKRGSAGSPRRRRADAVRLARQMVDPNWDRRRSV